MQVAVEAKAGTVHADIIDGSNQYGADAGCGGNCSCAA
jgi:hypothetical protein